MPVLEWIKWQALTVSLLLLNGGIQGLITPYPTFHVLQEYLLPINITCIAIAPFLALFHYLNLSRIGSPLPLAIVHAGIGLAATVSIQSLHAGIFLQIIAMLYLSQVRVTSIHVSMDVPQIPLSIIIANDGNEGQQVQ